MSEAGFCEIVTHNKEERWFEFKLKKWTNDPDSDEINPDFYLYLMGLLKELGIEDYDDWECTSDDDENDPFDHFTVEY